LIRDDATCERRPKQEGRRQVEQRKDGRRAADRSDPDGARISGIEDHASFRLIVTKLIARPLVPTRNDQDVEPRQNSPSDTPAKTGYHSKPQAWP